MASSISISVEDEERHKPLDPDCPLQRKTKVAHSELNIWEAMF